jgi:hypothetical protein
MEQGLQMQFADGALSSHLFSDEIEDSSSGSSGSLMKLKGFVLAVLALRLLDICYQINHSIKHHNIQMYLAVQSLTAGFFSVSLQAHRGYHNSTAETNCSSTALNTTTLMQY